MTKSEQIRLMTDVELASFLCDLVQDVAIKAKLSETCIFCPVSRMCYAGKNGFVSYLQKNAEED